MVLTLYVELTHWGRVMLICVSKLTIIGSDNGLLPGHHQAIIWTSAGILLIGSFGTNISEIVPFIHFHSRKCIWKCHLQNGVYYRLGPNVLAMMLRCANVFCTWYSISHEICTRFCFALLCCGYAIIHNDFTWSIYPYSSGSLCWHWGNR